MNILLLPKITSFYKGQYEYCIDKNWLAFLSETFPKSQVTPKLVKRNIFAIFKITNKLSPK